MACWSPGRLLIIGFGIVNPTMFTWPPYASMFGFNSIVVVLTLGLIIPLTAGDFDLSVASTLDALGDGGRDPQCQIGGAGRSLASSSPWRSAL